MFLRLILRSKVFSFQEKSQKISWLKSLGYIFWHFLNKIVCITYKHYFPNTFGKLFWTLSFLSLKKTQYCKRLKKELLNWILSYKAVSILSPNYVQNSPTVQSTLFFFWQNSITCFWCSYILAISYYQILKEPLQTSQSYQYYWYNFFGPFSLLIKQNWHP